MARLFFIQESDILGENIVFNDIDTRHFISLRKQTGDVISCVKEGENKETLEVKLIRNGNKFIGQITKRTPILISYSKKIHILQCIPKLDKMDLIIQKCAEMGAYSLTPIYSKNTDIHNDIGENKLTRWQKIARESSIQSGRMDIITIQNPVNIHTYLQNNKEILTSASSIDLIANEFEKDHTIHTYEADIASYTTSDIFLLVGAEGGFDTSEIETTVNEFHFKSISLGKNILRTETAPITLTAIIQYICKEI